MRGKKLLSASLLWNQEPSSLHHCWQAFFLMWKSASRYHIYFLPFVIIVIFSSSHLSLFFCIKHLFICFVIGIKSSSLLAVFSARVGIVIIIIQFVVKQEISQFRCIKFHFIVLHSPLKSETVLFLLSGREAEWKLKWMDINILHALSILQAPIVTKWISRFMMPVA
mgnify:CR=1 FL=1